MRPSYTGHTHTHTHTVKETDHNRTEKSNNNTSTLDVTPWCCFNTFPEQNNRWLSQIYTELWKWSTLIVKRWHSENFKAVWVLMTLCWCENEQCHVKHTNVFLKIKQLMIEEQQLQGVTNIRLFSKITDYRKQRQNCLWCVSVCHDFFDLYTPLNL